MGNEGALGDVSYQRDGALARVTFSHPGKFNAMSRAMWRELRVVFEDIARQPGLRCIWITGADGHFCAGGDIAQYPDFRFDAQQLHDFHELEVWGALQAMLDCNLPLLAQIEGNCMGAGLLIASCCDLRYAAGGARFGAPIARLGFPMAPREAALVAGAVGHTTARAMLLAAAVFDAPRMLGCGFLTDVLAADGLHAHCQSVVDTVLSLSPMAAQGHKKLFRELNRPTVQVKPASVAINSIAISVDIDPLEPYAYADHPEHREGIHAFLAKRKPQF
jgi:enoyl-CoA hydratase